MRIPYRHFSIILITLLLISLLSCSTDRAPEHPFEAYLAEPHPAYDYELESTIEGDGYTAYVIRMVSQEWLTADEVDPSVWWHWLTIVVPDEVNHPTALLRIGGGTSSDDLPDSVNPEIRDAALSTGTIAADLHNVPNQPLSFSGDDRMDERYEDDIIALGWRKFLEGGAEDDDAIWLSRFPMTAAAIRAIDTITSFADSEVGIETDEFVVTGASKRGWTAWTTAIFDERVIAVAPAVIDLLNMEPSFEHHWKAYGEWSPAIREYQNEGIMDWQGSTEYHKLRELVDPFTYLDRLTIPKYIVNAASDEFFLPDSWQFYWNDLPGEKAMRYVPNSGHNLSDSDAASGIVTFYQQIVNDIPTPEFDWEATDEGFNLRFDPDQMPDDLLLWSAHNPNSRDFRLYVIDRIWLASGLEIDENGEQFVEITTPDNGFTAWFVEARFDTGMDRPFRMTTGVKVTPDEYPYPAFESSNPLGTPISGAE
ncbi:MAG: PhoPQ-activated pathogenicity-related family protein [Balneolaceae bacterium]|nr:PhoPQ-activated pathogenicity-related family protein [Balneolaceae bacterium]MCH8549142.1 PhoPQ-activated pathogenicity-related family protein [Balneolaceae bacterium]